MKLHIERVEVFGLEVPLIKAFKLVTGVSTTQKCIVVRVTATDGITGLSSLEPIGGMESPEDMIKLLHETLAPAVIGADPANIHELLTRLDALSPAHSDAAVAIETACVDAVASSLGIPVYTYLGGAVKHRLEFNGWIGAVSPDEAAADALRWRNQGFKSTKIKVGDGIEADHDRIAAVRAAVGSEMKLRIDANQAYDADTSIELAKAVAPYNLQLFEEPARKGDLEGMARVRRKGGIPVMADESMTDHASLIAIIKADAADLVKVALKQCGGFHRTANIIATAEAAGIRCAVGHGFGTNVSTVAETALASISHNVIDGLECVGPLKMKDRITTTPVDLATGSFVLSDDPGLGLLLDVERIHKYQWAHVTVGK